MTSFGEPYYKHLVRTPYLVKGVNLAIESFLETSGTNSLVDAQIIAKNLAADCIKYLNDADWTEGIFPLPTLENS